jgi:hypothetical protein
MSLFGKFNLEDMIEKALEHIDMEQITAEVMADLKITDLEIYFVVEKPDGQDDYEFVGMAYSEDAACQLREDHTDREILKLDMMKMVPLAKQMGFVEVVR